MRQVLVVATTETDAKFPAISVSTSAFGILPKERRHQRSRSTREYTPMLVLAAECIVLIFSSLAYTILYTGRMLVLFSKLGLKCRSRVVLHVP